MTTTPVWQLVSSLTVPSIISMLVSGIYNLADTFFVGQINTQSAAALGIVFFYMALIQAIAFYFGQGSGISSPGRSEAAKRKMQKRWPL